MNTMSEASASTPLLSPVTDNGNVKESAIINKAYTPSDVPITWYSVCAPSVRLILIVVFCERLAFFSVLKNMVLFCMSELQFTGLHVSMTVWIFIGSVYMITPLIGGYVADSLCGRYKTILGSGVIYVIGKILLFFSACDMKAWFGFEKEGAKTGLFITSLVVITIGSGGIIANIAPFGAKQISHLGPRAVQSFYHWYYLAINIGSLASITVVYIQQQKTFYWGYLLSLLVLFLGIVVFLLGHRTYKHVPPSGKSDIYLTFMIGQSLPVAKCRRSHQYEIEGFPKLGSTYLFSAESLSNISDYIWNSCDPTITEIFITFRKIVLPSSFVECKESY